MNQDIEFDDSDPIFKCLICKNTKLSKHQLSDHLKLSGNHKISMLPNENPDSEKKSKTNIRKLISRRIESINNIKIEIQKTSIFLINLINQNTLISLKKLEDLSKVYYNMLINKVEDNKYTKKEIASTFCTKTSLFEEISTHFEQKIVSLVFSAKVQADGVNKEVLDVLSKHTDSVSCMVVYSDEKFIVTGGKYGNIRIWDAKNLKLDAYMHKHKKAILSMALASKNKILLTGSADCTVRLWNLKSKKEVHKFIGHSQAVTSVLILKSKKFGISGSIDGSIRVWDLVKKVNLHVLPLKMNISCINLFDDENKMVVAGLGGEITNYNFKYKEVIKKKLTKNKNSITCSRITTNENHFIFGDCKGIIQIWLIADLTSIFELNWHTDKILDIVISPVSDIFVSCSEDKSLVIFNFNELKSVHECNFKVHPVSIKFFNNYSSLVICHFNSKISFLNLISLKTQEKQLGKFVQIISISHDLRYLFYFSSKIYIIDLIGNSKKISIDSNHQIISANFSKNAEFLALGTEEGNIFVHAVPSLELTSNIDSNLKSLKYFVFSENNEFLAFCDKKTSIFIFNFHQKKKTPIHQKGVIEAATFFRKDKYFVYSKGSKIYILDREFDIVKKIKFEHLISRLIEFDGVILASENKEVYSSFDMKTFEISIRNESRNNMKNVSFQKENMMCYAYLKLLDFIYC